MNDDNKKNLRQFIREELNKPCHSAAHALVDAIMRRHGETVVAILYHGAGLRLDPSAEAPERIQNFYVIVDSLKRAFRRRPAMLIGSVFAPTVLYVERTWQKKRIRAKYAVVSRRQWRRGTSSQAWHSWLWARFSQPAALLYGRDSEAGQEVVEGMVSSAGAMVRAALPLMDTSSSVRDLWHEALAQSYQAELRPGKVRDRAALIFEADRARYEAITPLVLSDLNHQQAKMDGGSRLETSYSVWARRRCRWAWIFRRLGGKPLSLIRLAKSLFTVDGGVDYALWKVERRTGVRVPVSSFERRYPLLNAPRLLWRVYRLSAVR